MRLIYSIITILFLLTSCFKDDERIPPYDRGDRITATIELTQNYKYQVFFNLDENQVVSVNEKTNWDLAFECSSVGNHILLNTSNFMMSCNTGLTDPTQVFTQSGWNMTYDPSSGNLDSTAVNNWMNISNNDTIFSRNVYVIDRGYDELGNLLGWKKVVFDSIIGQTYYFRYGNLNSTELTSASINKKLGMNFVYFSFAEPTEAATVEPLSNRYDLVFGQYTTLLYTNEGDPYPYLVTGVLLNRFETLVAFDSIHHFDSITMEQVNELLFTRQNDRIGYNWKDVVGDVESGQVSYIVKPEWNYIIRSQSGFYFKMRFIGFYNNLGEKGFPTFEYQKL